MGWSAVFQRACLLILTMGQWLQPQSHLTFFSIACSLKSLPNPVHVVGIGRLGRRGLRVCRTGGILAVGPRDGVLW